MGTSKAWLCAVLLFLSACAANAQDKVFNAQPFGLWLEQFRQDAIKEGISEKTLDEAFADVEPLARVVELDRKQPESTLTIDEYLEKVVTQKRIEKGKEMLSEHKELLKKISGEYNVEPEYIVALWGIETNYGTNTGKFTIVEALATLAYEGRRSAFFRDELIKVLHISESDKIPPGDIKGSWAGAMGQCQFMPSSFLAFAVDYDKDGKRDIWNTREDVFASIANYLHESGWKEGEDNSKVLMKWNRSRYFVAAVQKIAQSIAE